ncbi:MAG: nucleotidyltransferase [Rhizobium sp.]|nr:MAG: nucleotidyltransferase [Rhizobium sp.]
MAWEDKFREWAQPPGATEEKRCENAVSAVKNALARSDKLKGRGYRVILQGSYRNNTNTKGESDVDIGVICSDTFFYELPDGMVAENFSIQPATYHYAEFKNDVGVALTSYFGAAAVTRGNKAFDVKETSYHVEADVAPFFEHRRYDTHKGFLEGVELLPDNGRPSKVINWPEQHYENGVAKNKATGMRFKAMVRVLKSLRNEMLEAKIPAAEPAVGFLIECLVWNAPNQLFGNTRYETDLRGILVFLYEATRTDEGCSEWGEVSELKYLFRGPQKWTREDANRFIVAAWNYVGFS